MRSLLPKLPRLLPKLPTLPAPVDQLKAIGGRSQGRFGILNNGRSQTMKGGKK